jgi:hypothetical protein
MDRQFQIVARVSRYDRNVDNHVLVSLLQMWKQYVPPKCWLSPIRLFHPLKMDVVYSSETLVTIYQNTYYTGGTIGSFETSVTTNQTTEYYNP